MQEIIQAIQEHASPRLYDWLILAVALLAIIVSGLAARYSHKLNQNQSAMLEQQNKITLFEKRYELYTIVKQLHWFGAKQKLTLQNDYKTQEASKLDIWRDTLATILVFTDAPDINKEIETKFHKKYLSTEIIRQKLSELDNLIDKLNDSNILKERRVNEYTYYFRLLYIEMLKATDKIEQMHLLFTLNKENTNSLVDISEGFEQTHKDLYDEKISPDTYLEKMIAFCAQLEKVNCFEEMINEMEIIKK